MNVWLTCGRADRGSLSTEMSCAVSIFEFLGLLRASMQLKKNTKQLHFLIAYIAGGEIRGQLTISCLMCTLLIFVCVLNFLIQNASQNIRALD